MNKCQNCSLKSSNNLTDLKNVASKWGRDVKVAEEKEEKGRTAREKTPCSCKNNEDVCQICDFPRFFSDAENSTDVNNAIIDYAKKPGMFRFPTKQLSRIDETNSNETSTTIEEQNLASKKHARSSPYASFHYKKPCTSVASSKCSLSGSGSCENPIKGVATYLKKYFGFEPVHCRHQHSMSSSSATSECLTEASSETSGFSPFPSAGTYERPNHKRLGDTQALERKPQGYVKEGKNLPVVDKLKPLNLRECDKHSYIKNKVTVTPSRPITAKVVRKGAVVYQSFSPSSKDDNQQEAKETSVHCNNDLKFTKNLQTVSNMSNDTNQKEYNETKIYPSTGVPSPNAPQEYWEQDSEKSEFSHPELKYQDELEYCVQCGGTVELKQLRDLTYTYRYLIHHDKGKRNKCKWFF